MVGSCLKVAHAFESGMWPNVLPLGEAPNRCDAKGYIILVLDGLTGWVHAS